MSVNKIKPTILFNCSTNVVGGGVKNSFLFILQTLENPNDIVWHYAISSEVAALLTTNGKDLDTHFNIFYDSPAKSVRSRKMLRGLVAECQADLVYTMAGPAYVKFPVPHVLGISNPYVTHAQKDVFKIYGGFLNNLKLTLRTIYQLYHSRHAEYFIFQTKTARDGFCVRTRINKSKTTVISNAFDSDIHSLFAENPVLSFENSEEINIICPGAAYVHKAFQFIPEIIVELNKLGDCKYKFTITLPDSPVLNEIMEKSKMLGIESYINNIGPFDYKDIPKLYNSGHIVFVPSLLETFSATYLEAMSANKILVVADKSFAREVCQDYALYVNPLNFQETAKQFKAIFDDSDSYIPIKSVGDDQLDRFGGQENRYNQIVAFLKTKLAKN